MTQETRIPGASSYAKRINKLIPRLATGKEDVLIVGESGSGRRTLALEIHNARGKRKPYILLDARSAIDIEVRSTITGQDPDEAEAMTGRKPTMVQDGATLVLADIEVLTPQSQELLIRFFKEGRKRFGNVKVILTLNRAFEQLAQSGALSHELVPFLEKCELVEVPALRERVEDIPALAETISARLCASFGVPPKSLSPNVSHVLSQGQWLGNIQQLVSVMGKAVLTSRGGELDLPADFLDEHQHLEDALVSIASSKPFILDQSLDLIEKLLIQRALRQFQYNQSKTASIFGLSEANFRYRLKKFGLPSIRRKV
jgi:DNA-binding NtrC family response regulator